MKKLRLARIPLLLTLVVVQFSMAMTTVQAAPLLGTTTFYITLYQNGAVSTRYPWTGQGQSHCDQLRAGQKIHYDADNGSTVTFSIYPTNNNNCTVAPTLGNLTFLIWRGVGIATPLYNMSA